MTGQSGREQTGPEPAKRAKAPPKPSFYTQVFWEATKQHRLMLQYDPVARRYQFFPRPMSLFGTTPLEWKPACGRGTLVALTECRAPAPGFEAESPYLIGLVRLEEGPRVFAQIVNAAPEVARIGAALRLAWDDSRPEFPMYQFEPMREPMREPVRGPTRDAEPDGAG